MANFNPAVDKIIDVYEKGYANNPHDLGGETKFGIAKRFHPGIDIKNLTREHAEEIYKNEYWDPPKLDNVNNQGIAEELLDISINIGQKSAALFLQQALNLILPIDILVDGIVGPKTIGATNTYRYPGVIVKILNGLQFEHYHKRLIERPDQEIFLRSWLQRVEFKET